MYRGTAAGAESTTPLNNYPITDTTYNDLTVVNGTTYYYVIKAVDTAALLSAASQPEVWAKPSSRLTRNWLESDPYWWGRPLEGAQVARAVDPGSVAPYRATGYFSWGMVRYLHTDHLGSVRLVTDWTGAVLTKEKYLPYGDEIQPPVSSNPFRYAGYERDTESGMDYVRARFYKTAHGRWQSPDPLGGGFKYAANNPVAFFDPSGLLTCPPGGGHDPHDPCHEDPIIVTPPPEPEDPQHPLGPPDPWVTYTMPSEDCIGCEYGPPPLRGLEANYLLGQQSGRSNPEVTKNLRDGNDFS